MGVCACTRPRARVPARTHAHSCTHRPIYNTYCFSNATMVTRTRLNVTLYVHCLSCSIPWHSTLNALVFIKMLNEWETRFFSQLCCWSFFRNVKLYRWVKLPTFRNTRSPSSSGSSSSSYLFWPTWSWSWKHHDPSKFRWLLTTRHCVNHKRLKSSCCTIGWSSLDKE